MKYLGNILPHYLCICLEMRVNGYSIWNGELYAFILFILQMHFCIYILICCIQYNIYMKKRQEIDIIGPLISIKDNDQKGVSISWNFSGVMPKNQCECFHIFVFIGPTTLQAAQFLNYYYDSLKLGDLLGIFKPEMNQSNNQRIKWRQKTAFRLQSNFLKKKHIFRKFTPNSFSQLLFQIQKKQGLVLVNLLLDQLDSSAIKSNTQLIKSLVTALRLQCPNLPLIFNLISHNENSRLIDCLLGLNYFCYNRGQKEETVKEIKGYVKMLAIKYIKIGVEVKNGKHCKQGNLTEWKISQFSEFQKIYYGVPACSFEEYLIFLLNQNDQEIQLQLIFNLEVWLCNGKEIRAKRQVKFMTNSNSFKSRTAINNQDAYGVTQLANKQYLRSNLIKKFTYFWVFNNSNKQTQV